MSFICGQSPRIRNFLTAVAGLLFAASVAAQQDIPLTLYAAEDLALKNEPGRAALIAKAEALEEKSVAAGQLPDPVLRTALLNFPIQSGGFTTEGMTQAQLGIRQAFPPGHTRAASTRRFEALAGELRQSADGRDRDVLMSVRQAWLDTYYWQRAHTIVNQSRPLFADLVTVTRSLYSVGRADQQDLLRAELELSRIDDRLIDIEKQQARAVAALSEWVGQQAGRPIAEKLPAWQPAPALQALQEKLLNHPALHAADARIDARQAGIDIAEESFKPGWSLDLGYGYRNGRLANGSPRSDFVTVAVTMDLPFFRKNRQDRDLAAAVSERRAARQSKQELLRRLKSRLESEYAQWADLNRRIELYERQILPLSGDHARATLVAYQSDAADFADVMHGYIDDLNTRVDHVRLQVERAKAYAAIANLGGLPR